jgi:hypothetical protein
MRGLRHRPGILFGQQTAAAIKQAVALFEAKHRAITPEACRQNAARFSTERFHREIAEAFDEAVAMHA